MLRFLEGLVARYRVGGVFAVRGELAVVAVTILDHEFAFTIEASLAAFSSPYRPQSDKSTAESGCDKNQGMNE